MKQSTHLLKKTLLTTAFIGAVLSGNAQNTKVDKAVSWIDTLKIHHNGQTQVAFKEVKVKTKFFTEVPEHDIYADYKKIIKTYQSNIDPNLYIVLAGKYASDYSKDILDIHSKKIIYKNEQDVQYTIRMEVLGVSPEITYILDSAGVFKTHQVQVVTDMLFYIFGRNIALQPELMPELVKNKIALQERIHSLIENKPKMEALNIAQALKKTFLLNYIDTITVADNEGKRIKAYNDVSEYDWSNHRTYQSVTDKNLYLNISYNHVNGDPKYDNDAANLTFIYGNRKSDNYPSIDVELSRGRKDEYTVTYDMGLPGSQNSKRELLQLDPVVYGNLLREVTQRPASLPEIIKEKLAFKASL